MNASHVSLRFSNLHPIIVACGLLLCTQQLFSDSYPKTVAFAEKRPDYQRTMLPSGKYRPETYVFGQGVIMDKSDSDESVNALSFAQVARILADALYEADYIPTPKASETELLILVSWGRTQPMDSGISGLAMDGISRAVNNMGQLNYLSDDRSSTSLGLSAMLRSEFESEIDSFSMMQRMADTIRNEQNTYNAQLLGYGPDLERSQIFGDTVLTMQSYHNDLMNELEEPRYFVILQAYDFQKMKNEKKRDLLWTSRFSIRAKGRRFDENLWAMAMASSRVFGGDSEVLKRHLTPGRVEFGELEYMGVEQ